jgi:16S rRNA (cytosine967-C5)-methyltransferase
MGLPRAKGLINAVLRNFLREPEKFKRERFKQEVARYDFPMWWIKRLKRESPSQWESILLSARVHPPMSLRINCRKVSIPEYLAVLERHGIKAKAFGDNAVMLEKPMPVVDVPGFREGHVSVQDIGAQGAARLLAPRAGMRVLDACAAPGGKTGHLLEMADIDLTAIDSDRFRMKRVSDNLHRLGLHATLHVADAADISAWWDGKPFDRILLDVPCSGSGVVRRHPDIKWIRRESDLAGFARQQEKLLDALWNCLAVGGRLLYATCSVFRSENQDVVTRFLKTKTDVVPLDLAALTANEDVAVRLNEDGQLLPDDHHDGFFYALLEKAA